MIEVPNARPLVVHVAMPELMGCAVQASMSVPLAVKSTVPVSGASPGSTTSTVAVKVTGAVKAELSSLEVTAVVVSARPTDCEKPGEVLEA